MSALFDLLRRGLTRERIVVKEQLVYKTNPIDPNLLQEVVAFRVEVENAWAEVPDEFWAQVTGGNQTLADAVRWLKGHEALTASVSPSHGFDDGPEFPITYDRAAQSYYDCAFVPDKKPKRKTTKKRKAAKKSPKRGR